MQNAALTDSKKSCAPGNHEGLQQAAGLVGVFPSVHRLDLVRQAVHEPRRQLQPRH